MKAYKVFSSDWTCRGFQYKVGETYEIKDEISICEKGFHASKKLVDCFNYYAFDKKNKVAMVEIIGNFKEIDDKIVTDKIKILHEIKWCEVLEIVNIGDFNSGDRNSGYRNSGDRNSGDFNSGYGNSGDRNSGDRNSGDGNSGNGNSGDRNSGDGNSGNGNSGNGNSGYRNSGNFNSANNHIGIFNSRSPQTIYIFNKLVDISEVKKIINTEGYNKLCKYHLYKYRVRTRTGKYGDYRYCSYKQSWKIFFSKLTAKEKLAIKRIPYFDSDVFFEITGVKL